MNWTVRSGRICVTFTTATPALLPVLESPPPDTLTVLVMLAGALAVMLTGSVSVREAPAASGAVLTQLTVLRVEAAQFQSEEESGSTGMSPVGMMSVIVKGEVVGPFPLFVTVMA